MIRRATQTGATVASPPKPSDSLKSKRNMIGSRGRSRGGNSRKLKEAARSGCRLLLFDPESRNEPIKISKVTYTRRGKPSGKPAGKLTSKIRGDIELAAEIKASEEGQQRQVTARHEGSDGDYDEETFEDENNNDGDSVLSDIPDLSRKLSDIAASSHASSTKPRLEKKKKELQPPPKSPQPETSSTNDAAPSISNEPLRESPPPRPKLTLVITPDDLAAGKASLKDKGGKERKERYLPQSPLNLNSKILSEALNKGKAKLKKVKYVPQNLEERESRRDDGGGRIKGLKLTEKIAAVSTGRRTALPSRQKATIWSRRW